MRFGLVGCVMLAALPLAAADAAVASARAQYARTNYEAALRTLKAVPQKGGAAWELTAGESHQKHEPGREPLHAGAHCGEAEGVPDC